jgi:hypothetical protein
MVEYIPPPGAARSGFTLRSGDMPYELKGLINPAIASGKIPVSSTQVVLTGSVAKRSSSATPSAAVIHYGRDEDSTINTLHRKNSICVVVDHDTEGPCILSVYQLLS